eukprot:TRINITY_DN11619_c0_g1_i1.p1 TRINITY_DN11619_c0_g1~~TRINITY_DN11619_c0_g1_i1.p1  ORF type:complete len:634 (-),score=111.15 TRINITY_DN11619_c0_g1_i1:603-2447(-)
MDFRRVAAALLLQLALAAADGHSAAIGFLERRDEAPVDSTGESRAPGYNDEDMVEAPRASRAMWTQSGAAEPERMHELLFYLNQQNLDELEKLALDRSNPASPNYGKWMSRNEVWQLTRNPRALAALKKQLLVASRDVAITQVTPGGEFVRAAAPISVWSRLLRAEFYAYMKNDTKEVYIRTDRYTLPRSLRDHVAGVMNAIDLHTQGFFRAKVADTEMPPEAARAQLREAVTTPDKLRAAYNMPAVAMPDTAPALERANTSQAVFASLDQHWSPRDRALFQEGLGLPVHSVTELDSGNSMKSNRMCMESPQDCAEANLDVQYMMAMSPYSSMGLYSVPSDSTFGDFLFNIANLDEPPHVISISYGEDENTVTMHMALAFEVEAMKLALQGITLVVASGDDGASGTAARHKSWWFFPSCERVRENGLQVNWPASSAWVTSVGATLGVATDRSPEVVCQVNASTPWGATPPVITSGGGYSGIIATPEWQINANSQNGRGVPDVAVNGHAFAIVVGGRWLSVDGTSASAPSFAGMISLLNARRKAAGYTTLGFLNPLLYANPDAFNDITVGDNRCASKGTLCCGGYDARVGWDPVTGLGTPDFSQLEQAVSSLAQR